MDLPRYQWSIELYVTAAARNLYLIYHWRSLEMRAADKFFPKTSGWRFWDGGQFTFALPQNTFLTIST